MAPGYSTRSFLATAPRLFAAGAAVLLYGFGRLATLIRNYLKLSATERRQMRVLTVGTVAGWAPGLLFLAAIFLAPFTDSPLVWALVVPPFKHVALAMFVLVPVSLAYAVVQDQVLDMSP